MKKMSTYGKGSEDAVSPVIGVILMVAITVILAAVIAAFVFGMAGNVSKTKNVAVTAQRTGPTTATLTNNGGADVASVGAFNATWGATINNNLGKTVGSTVTVTNATGVAGTSYRMLVTATFNDGSQQVILDTNV